MWNGVAYTSLGCLLVGEILCTQLIVHTHSHTPPPPSTGDEEPELDLSELVDKQQVAWLHHEAVPDTTPRAPKPKPKPKRNYSDDEEEYLEEEEDEDEAELDDDDDDFDPRYADAKSPRKKPKKKKPRAAAPQQARYCRGVCMYVECHVWGSMRRSERWMSTMINHVVDNPHPPTPHTHNHTGKCSSRNTMPMRSNTQQCNTAMLQHSTCNQ